MDQLYTQKVLLLFIITFLFANTQALATNSPTYCGTVADTVFVDADHSRYTIEIDKTVEEVILSDLIPGAEYQLWISSAEVAPDCIFSLLKNNPKQSSETVTQQTLSFKAKHVSESIYIQNSNCSNLSAYFADLSISKKAPDDVNAMLNMMGIMTDASYTAQQLIEDVFIGGGCFEVSNVQAIGNPQGIGYFSSGTSSVNIDEGVILASGAIGNSAGPNTVTNITTNFFDGSGDPDLDILATGAVFDAVGIEFDFTPVVNTVQFSYVFASDEYCDYVNTAFNDAFGFFISGPGLNGPYTSGGENIAVVPGTNQDVTINTINIQTNAGYYVDNVPVGQPQNAGGCVGQDLNNPGAAEQDIEYDGYTTVITATANVQVCETYHIRLVIGDVNDGIFDSAVFLAANSFNTGGDVSMDVDLPGLGSTGTAYEGCAGDGYIIFERPPDGDLSQPYTVFFNISPASTATNGTDFSNLPPSITIPAGQTQFLLPLSIYDDLITEGVETLILELDNPCTCQDASIEILIDDVPPMEVTTPDFEFCNEQQVTLLAEVGGGIPGYTYQWSTGGNGPSITVDAITGVQTVTVTVTDDCGNEEESISTITVGEESYAFIEGFAEVCENNPTGTLIINFTGMGPWDLTYLIDGVPQPPLMGITENPYILIASEPGIYTIGSLLMNDCPGIGEGSGIVLPTIFNSFAIPTPVTCPGDFNGSIDFILTGGSPGYNYEWSNDQYTEDIDNLEPGIYFVTATDANGCTHIDSAEILVPDSIIAAAVELQGVNCLDTLSGAADLTVSGGSPSYTFEWDNGETVEDAVSLSEGPHTVMITDSLGCVSEAAVTINQDADPPVALAEVDGVLTCDELQVVISGFNSSGGDSLSFSWLNAGGVEISTDTLVDVLDPGSYTLVVTNLINGCSDETSITVDQNVLAPVADAGENGVLNCIETMVSLDGAGSSSGSTITYEWLDENDVIIGEEVSIDVEEAGTYSLIVTDTENGCTALAEVTVDVNENLPNPDAIVDGIINCNETNATIDASGSTGNGPITFQWLDENDIEISIDESTSVENPGIYTLIITDTDNGCTSQTTIEVLENSLAPNPEVVEPEGLTCTVSSVLLNGANSNGQGTISYQWEDSDGMEVGISSEVSVTAPGVYTLIITDAENGCTAETTVTVDQNIENPIPDAIVDGVLTCSTLDVLIDGSGSTASGDLDYLWLDYNDLPIGNESTYDINTPGIYTLIITNSENGCTAETTVEVAQDINDPSALAVVDTLLNCAINSVHLDGSASSGNNPIDYQWLDSNGVPISNAPELDVLDAGTYNLIITDQVNGCTSETSVLVDANFETPQPDAIVDGLLTCENLSVLLDGSNSSSSGNLDYQWLDENNIEISTTPSTEVSSTGSFTLIITDQLSACTESITIDVEEDITPPIADAGPQNTLTCDIETVVLNGNNSTTGTNISYEWISAGGTTVSNEITAEVGQAGSYTLVVTNTDNGCTASDLVEVVPDDNLPTVDAGLGSLLTCDILDATLIGNASGMNAVSVEWLDPNGISIDTTLEIIVTNPGTYTLIVLDESNGCTASSSVEITQNINAPQSIPGNSPTLTCTETEATLDGSGSLSSFGDLEYQWYDSNDVLIGTDSVVQVDMAGTYSLVVIAGNGCSNTSQVDVLLDANVPISDPGENAVLDCNVSMVTLGSTETSTGMGITYQWINSNNEVIGTSQFLDVDIPDTYTLVVFNSNNDCEISAQAIVAEDTNLPEVDAGAGGLLTCEETQILLGGTGTSNGAIYQYEWTDINNQVISTDSVYSIDEPGTYTITVFNTENGCQDSEEITIDQNIDTPLADAGPSGILTCDVTSVMLDGSSSQGQNLSYSWLNEGGIELAVSEQIEVTETGVYTLVITNTLSACTSSATVEVVPDENVPTAEAVEIGILTCDNDVVQIDAGNSSTVSGNINYEWFDINNDFLTNDASTLVNEPGVYTVIITDTDNGCTSSALVEVPQDIENPEAFAGNNDTLTCLITTLQLNGSAANGVSFGYEWLDANNNSIAQSPNVTVNDAGLYTLLVTNLTNGCTASDQVELIQDADLPLAVAGPAEILTCTVQSIILDASSSEQGPTIDYEWQDSNGNTLSDQLQVEITEPGDYTIIVYNTDNSCVAQDIVSVQQDIQDPIAAVDPVGPLELNCDVAEVVLNGENSTPFPELSFDWTTVDGNIITATDIFEIEVDEPGLYTLTVVNQSNGCTDVQTYNIGQDITPPSAFINNPAIINCYAPEINVNATNNSGNGNFDFLWTSLTGAGIVDGETTLNLTVNQPGTYILTVENQDNGCDYSTDIEVLADLETPNAVATVDDELDCVTESVDLNGEGSSTGSIYNYEWQGNGILAGTFGLTPTVNQSGIYTLLVTNIENGCTQTEDVLVLENENVPDALDFGIVPPPCPGDAASIQILGVTGGEGPYLYSIDGGENFYDITLFNGLNTGDYDLVVQDAIGCEYEEYINIPEAENIFLQMDLDLEISLGDTVELNGYVNVPEWALSSVLWTPGNTLSCDSCLQTMAFPNQTTTYTLNVLNENGCPASDKITLRVRKDRGIYIPNVFSPFSSSGANDIFHIFSDGKSVRNINTFQIFDRWGEKVFEDFDFQPDDPAHGWDGYLRGEPMNPAVFVYWAEVEFIDGEVLIFKGDVTLVR